jgi:hypothetical protein
MVLYACQIRPLAPPAEAIVVLGGARLFSVARVLGADQALLAARPLASVAGAGGIFLIEC